MHPMSKRAVAEAFGTFVLVLGGCGSAVLSAAFPSVGIGLLGVSLAFGLTVLTMAYAFGHISGGHFNPAVSAGLAIARKFPTAEVVPYWVAQLVGGFLAVVVQAIVFDSAVTDGLSTAPGAGIDDWGALVLEIVTTALFVMVILTVATDGRAAWKGVMAPLSIGLFIFVAATTVGPSSGGSFNPARSLDPVLWNQEWGDVWIYIIGPLAGGVLGAAIWTSLVGRGSEEAAST